MRDDYFYEQFNIAQSSKDAFGVKTVVAAFAALLMSVLSAIGLSGIVIGIAGAILSVAVFIFCAQELGDGFISIFRLQPSNDSFNSVAVIVSAFQSLVLIFNSNPNNHTFTPVIFASVAVSMAMKYVFVNEIINNLNLVKNNSTFVVNVEEVKLTKRYIERVCVVNPVVKFPNVVDSTYSEDPSEEKIRLFVPITCGAVFVISVIIGFFHGFNVFSAALAALFAVAASFTGEAAYVLPYIVAQKRLRKLGSVLLGYGSIESLRNIETLSVSDTDLFPKKFTEMESFRFRDRERMADAVEYTAAILSVSKSPFDKTFIAATACKKDLLPKVDDWRYMKNYGILSHIYGDEVLLGNRNMLLSYDILPLSQEIEASLVSTNRNILYIAINGVVAAYMIMRYICDPKMKKAAESVGDDFSIIVETNDCNITETMVQKRYEIHNTKIMVLDADEIKLLSAAREHVEENNPHPVMISTKNAIGILSSVRQAKRLSSVIDMSVHTKLASIIFGVLLTTVAFFMVPASPDSLWIFLFNLIWTIPALVLSFIKK